MNLSEAVSNFRSIEEAIKVGDFVAAADGRDGYVDAINGNMVTFTHTTYKGHETVSLPAELLNTPSVEAISGPDKAKRKLARLKWEASPAGKRAAKKVAAMQRQAGITPRPTRRPRGVGP